MNTSVPRIVLESAQNESPGNSQEVQKRLQVRTLYSWEKEIVSPVGEYIRGKRSSQFKNSPNKRTINDK